MKQLLILSTICGSLLYGGFTASAHAAIEALKPEPVQEESDTVPTWTIEITPAPGLNSYATRNVAVPLHQDSTDAAQDSSDTIVIKPRDIPDTPVCENCQTSRHPIPRVTSRYSNWNWLRNAEYADIRSVPALYLYSDLIRSNWFGSPYRGHYFYYNGYRPSFRFGSLQFRGFGNYDRMYNPRIMPFGYQYAGPRSYYTALALTSMFPTLP